jgi:hypothetical protein
MTRDEEQYVTVLIEEAAKRLNKRTKAYKLLEKALRNLKPPASLAAVNDLFKKLYVNKNYLANLMAPTPLLTAIKKV